MSSQDNQSPCKECGAELKKHGHEATVIRMGYCPVCPLQHKLTCPQFLKDTGTQSTQQDRHDIGSDTTPEPPQFDNVSQPTARLKKGYFGIGMWEPKFEENLGMLFRSAHAFGADFVFTIGSRYKRDYVNTTRFERHIPLYFYADFDDFMTHRPLDAKVIGIELTDKAVPLESFRHPKQAIYLLGGEDRTLPLEITDRLDVVCKFSTPICTNVAVAGSVALYDRHQKMSPEALSSNNGLEEMNSPKPKEELQNGQ